MVVVNLPVSHVELGTGLSTLTLMFSRLGSFFYSFPSKTTYIHSSDYATATSHTHYFQ